METYIRKKKINLPLLCAILMSLTIGFVSVLPLNAMAIFIGLMFLPFLLAVPLEKYILLIALFIFFDKSFITFQGSYIRIYQLLFLLTTIKFVIECSFHNVQLRRMPLIVLLNVWVLSFFLAYPHLLSPKDFWVLVIGQVFLNFFYYVIVQTLATKGASFYDKVLRFTVLSSLIVAAYGILEWISFFIFGVDIGIGHYESIGIPRPSSFAHEPDWYGLFCAYGGIWFFVWYLRKDNRFFSQRFVLFGLAACFLGVFISMARASMVSLAVAILFLYIVTRDKKIIKLIAMTILAFVLLMASLFVVNPSIAENIMERLNPSTSTATDSGATDSRMASIQLMLDYIPLHPYVGNGSGGMAMLTQSEELRAKYIYGGEMNEGKGNANIFLTFMFDTGMIGTFIFILILMRIVHLHKAVFSRRDDVALGLACASILLLVDFNFNNGFRMGFVWFHLALVAAYYLLMKRAERQVSQ